MSEKQPLGFDLVTLEDARAEQRELHFKLDVEKHTVRVLKVDLMSGRLQVLKRMLELEEARQLVRAIEIVRDAREEDSDAPD